MIKRIVPTLCALMFLLTVVKPVHALVAPVFDAGDDRLSLADVNASPSPSPSATSQVSSSPTNSPSPTASPTVSPSASASPSTSATPTHSPTAKPTIAAVVKKKTPSPSPTVSPSISPTVIPTTSSVTPRAEVKGASTTKASGGPSIITSALLFILIALFAGSGVFLLRKNPKVNSALKQ